MLVAKTFGIFDYLEFGGFFQLQEHVFKFLGVFQFGRQHFLYHFPVFGIQGIEDWERNLISSPMTSISKGSVWPVPKMSRSILR